GTLRRWDMAGGMQAISRYASWIPHEDDLEPREPPSPGGLQPPAGRRRADRLRVGVAERVRGAGLCPGPGPLPPRRSVGRLAGARPPGGRRLGGDPRRRLPRARLRSGAGALDRRRGQGLLRGVLERRALAALPRPARRLRLRALVLVQLSR